MQRNFVRFMYICWLVLELTFLLIAECFLECSVDGD